MPTKFTLAAGIIASAILFDRFTFISRRELKLVGSALEALNEENSKLCQAAQTLEDEVVYLVHKLNENDIQLTEFDLIALPHVTVQS